MAKDQVQENQTEDQAKPEETKAQAFTRIAERRVTNVLNALGTLRGLSNASTYEYTDAQWEQIFGAIDEEVESIKLAVSKGGKVAKSGFSLS